MPADAPPAGILNAHHAVVLRTGWDCGDLATAVSCCRSPMGHIQLDGGSLVIGTGGRWFIDDPGYQQYMNTAERQFTIGAGAHNGPVINGSPQTHRRTRLLERAENEHDLRVTLDLTACYDLDVNRFAASRTVWLVGRQRAVVVADRVAGVGLEALAYHWHGHPDAAWQTVAGAAALHIGASTLHILSPHVTISDPAISRMPGSRGQLTLQVELSAPPPMVWWVFSCSDTAPTIALDGAYGASLVVGGCRFECPRTG
jgi:hypothetical protein